MELKVVKTGVDGLDYYRLPCAIHGKKEKALVVFIADDMETISKHVLVSDRRRSFRWDTGSFRSQPFHPSDAQSR